MAKSGLFLLKTSRSINDSVSMPNLREIKPLRQTSCSQFFDKQPNLISEKA